MAGDNKVRGFPTPLAIPSRELFIVKKFNESVNNSAALQDDNEFKFPVQPRDKWFVEMFLQFTSTTAVPGFRLAFTGPAAPKTLWYHILVNSYGGLVSGNDIGIATAFASTMKCPGIGTPSAMIVKLFLENGASSGLVKFQWAQETATGEDSTLLAGSTLMARSWK